MRSPRGKTVGYLGIAQDITTSKRQEDALRKLSQAVEQSPTAVVLTDPDGNIEYVNPKFTQTTGYSQEEVIGKNPRFLKSGETSSEEYRDLWDTITVGKEWRGEFHNKRKDGSLVWEHTSISPVRDANGVISHYLAIK
jgi:PAS domain S-box-containing protein